MTIFRLFTWQPHEQANEIQISDGKKHFHCENKLADHICTGPTSDTLSKYGKDFPCVYVLGFKKGISLC